MKTDRTNLVLFAGILAQQYRERVKKIRGKDLTREQFARIAVCLYRRIEHVLNKYDEIVKEQK